MRGKNTFMSEKSVMIVLYNNRQQTYIYRRESTKIETDSKEILDSGSIKQKWQALTLNLQFETRFSKPSFVVSRRIEEYKN